MATERLSMRKTREILRLKWVLKRSHREIKGAVGVGLATVSDTIDRATTAQLDWPAVEALSDDELEHRLHPKSAAAAERPLPDPATLDLELRKVGVTLRLLHLEYVERTPVGAYGYTQFCDAYRAWKQTQRVTMRQVHRAGDKLFVDYSGKKPHIVDPETGARIEVELFHARYVAPARTRRTWPTFGTAFTISCHPLTCPSVLRDVDYRVVTKEQPTTTTYARGCCENVRFRSQDAPTTRRALGARVTWRLLLQ